jgi:DeoR family suf operon transcriptional repressor
MQTRRQEILTILKQEGEATVDELAGTLDLTPVTVRHHLDILRAEGLVEASAIRRRRGPGRPQYVYTLTADASSHFPMDYDGLTNELLDEITSTLGPQTVKSLLDGIAERRLEQAPEFGSDLNIEERLERLVDFMIERGHLASLEKNDGGWFLHASNCPYQNVATSHPELCAMDLFLIKQLSGLRVVCHQRIADGAHSCIYEIRPQDSH